MGSAIARADNLGGGDLRLPEVVTVEGLPLAILQVVTRFGCRSRPGSTMAASTGSLPATAQVDPSALSMSK